MEDIVFQFLTIGLVLLFVISFALFVRRLLVNSTVKNNQLMKIGKKLDRIIEHMENDKNNKG